MARLIHLVMLIVAAQSSLGLVGDVAKCFNDKIANRNARVPGTELFSNQTLPECMKKCLDNSACLSVFFVEDECITAKGTCAVRNGTDICAILSKEAGVDLPPQPDYYERKPNCKA